MKTLTISIFLALAVHNLAPAQDLGDFRWQHRIVLLMDPYGNPECERQLQELQEHTAGMQERDILLFVFNGKALLDEKGNPTPISVQEVPYPTFEGVILIGKDGGVKMKKNYHLTAEFIFDRIDAMPMRKAELREGNKG